MHYAEDRYGYSFDLPEGWARMPLAGQHFECAGQHIQMMTGTALPEFLTREARERHLWEPNCRIVANARHGSEANTVVIMNDADGTAAISAIQNRIHYFFEFDGARHAETTQAIESILRTFNYPSSAQALQRAEDFPITEQTRRNVAGARGRNASRCSSSTANRRRTRSTATTWTGRRA